MSKKVRRKPRRFPKVAPREVPIHEAVADAWSIIEELTGEMTDWRDNLDNGNMSHTPKYDTVSECCDALEGGSEVDEPTNEKVKAIKFQITDQQPRARAYSRADRLSHAVYLLEQSMEALEEFADPTTQQDADAETAANEYRQSIEELKDAVEAADFPGMY